MKTTLCTWEDEDCNRQVQFSIDYSIENGAIEIGTVTPRKVSFICQESNSVMRSVSVNTDTGRTMLANQFRETPAYQELSKIVASPNADIATPHLAVRMDVCSA